jgi:transcriptional regulator with XRE-family HTH domain
MKVKSRGGFQMNAANIKLYIASQIKKYRKLAGLTQKELGEKIGVKHNTISSYESGTNEPEQDMLFKIANALGVSINDLFPPTENPRFGQGIPSSKIGDDTSDLMRSLSNSPKLLKLARNAADLKEDKLDQLNALIDFFKNGGKNA